MQNGPYFYELIYANEHLMYFFQQIMERSERCGMILPIMADLIQSSLNRVFYDYIIIY